MNTLRSLALMAAVLLVGCDGYFHTPAVEPARVGVAFQQIAGGAASAFAAADNAAVEVRSGNATLFAEVVDLEPSGTGVAAEVSIDLPDGATTASVDIDLRVGTEVLFTGSTTVSLAPGEVTEVTVPLDPLVASIDLDDVSVFTIFGEAQALEGRALFASGHEVPGVELEWLSQDPGVVVVEQTTQGWQAVAVADGSATLQASGGGRQATTVADVLAVVVEIEVVPDALSLTPGASSELTALLRDAGGSPIPGRARTWSSDAPAVATVDAGGVVTGVAPGQASIEVRSGAAFATAAVVVSPPGPSVETLPASSISSTSAVLAAEVDPMGQATTVLFEYSTSPDLSQAFTTSISSVSASSPPEVVSTSVAGLPSGERIHFRAVATNASGTTAGEILHFDTPPVPATPTGLAGSYSEGVYLTWVDNSSTELYFEIERDVISLPGSVSGADSNGASTTPARVYQNIGTTGAGVTEFYDFSPPYGELRYRVRACHDEGCSPWSTALTWYYGLPPEVTTLPATNVTEIDVRLEAIVHPMGAPTDVYWEVAFDPEFTTPPPEMYPASPLYVGEGIEEVRRWFDTPSIQPGFRYARAVAENWWGVTYGNVITFEISGGEPPE